MILFPVGSMVYYVSPNMGVETSYHATLWNRHIFQKKNSMENAGFSCFFFPAHKEFLVLQLITTN